MGGRSCKNSVLLAAKESDRKQRSQENSEKWSLLFELCAATCTICSFAEIFLFIKKIILFSKMVLFLVEKYLTFDKCK